MTTAFRQMMVAALLAVLCGAVMTHGDVLASCARVANDPELLDRIDFVEVHAGWGATDLRKESFAGMRELLKELENNYPPSKLQSAWAMAESKFFFFDAEDVLIATCPLPADASVAETRALLKKAGILRAKKKSSEKATN